MNLEKKPKSLTFWGGGNMGQALLRAWHGAENWQNIAVIDPQPMPDFVKPIANLHWHHPDQAQDILSQSDLVVIALKPDMCRKWIPLFQKELAKAQMIISVAAGISLAELQNWLPGQKNIIRAMPNTPIAIGKGMTALCASQQSHNFLRQFVESLWQATGTVVWLEEEKMDVATAVAGSGPAYLFYFTETLIGAGMEMGLDREMATKLARSTMIGAAALMAQSDESVQDLRVKVTSPGGTTAAALASFMQDDRLADLVEKAVRQAVNRCQELRDQ